MDMSELEQILTQAQTELTGINTEPELNLFHTKYLGRKDGTLTKILRELKDVPLPLRRELGARVNQGKNTLETLISVKQQELVNQKVNQRSKNGYFDFTLPGRPFPIGHLHPITQIFDEIQDIFSQLGFSLAEGPEIETEYYNFDALNMPSLHPSRDMQDTLYLEHPGTQNTRLLLRTHTSPVQIRTMEKFPPPLRIIAPGRVYRHEAIDASHSVVFHQVEGFAVDENISFADLKGTLTYFIKSMFGVQAELRFRPSYFPFVEPGAEVDMTCVFCQGKGCPVCKHSGYLELLGAGMIHPHVFEAVKYDSEKYTGFAFGIGVERVAMLKYQINDLRLFYENDLRFLTQF